jgi:hypothetical protein
MISHGAEVCLLRDLHLWKVAAGWKDAVGWKGAVA